MAGVAAPGVAGAEVSVADRADDPGLRRVMRASVMPGAVRVAFTREPDYFAADGLAGAEDVTVVARRSGQVAGVGRCSIYSLMCNGTPHRIGYLSVLRVTDGTKASARLLREGYDVLGSEVLGRADGFFTSIASDNLRARRVLERGGRLGLPAYAPLCDLVTLVAPVSNEAPGEEHANEAEIGDFLTEQVKPFHLTLDWDRTIWPALRKHELSVSDFAVVRRTGRIVAAAAVWDQRAFRQTVIDGYERLLGRFRPVVNAALALRRRPMLPPPGTVMAQGAILGASVPDPRDWPALWRQLQHRATTRGLSWLTISRDARDAELPALRRLMRAREYHTTLYEVTWAGQARWPDRWDARLFRPEVALL